MQQMQEAMQQSNNQIQELIMQNRELNVRVQQAENY